MSKVTITNTLVYLWFILAVIAFAAQWSTDGFISASGWLSALLALSVVIFKGVR